MAGRSGTGPGRPGGRSSGRTIPTTAREASTFGPASTAPRRRVKRANAKLVGDYFWRESGKLGQKQSPEDFEGVKWWDVWGMVPVEVQQELPEADFVKIRRVLRRKRDEVAGVKVRIRDPSGRLVPRRREISLDGV